MRSPKMKYSAKMIAAIFAPVASVFLLHASTSEKFAFQKSTKLYQKIGSAAVLTDDELKAVKNCGSNLFPDVTLKLENPAPDYTLNKTRSVQDQVGDIRKFNAIDFNTNQATKEITARAERVGTYSYIYVDTTLRFNDDQLDALLFLFDNQIYPTNTDVFGSEPKPGIDGDERITVLFLAIEEPASVVGDIAGYFWSGNQFSRNQVSRSNEREMLYMDISRLGRFGVEDVAGTLAHEFQHLIHWNYDRSEEVWINEGLSEYATFRNGFRLSNPPSLFLDNPDFTLMGWSRHPRDYARAFLWIAYLADHYGGDPLLRSIVANTSQGVGALQATLSQSEPGLTVDDVFSNWIVANYLDASGDDNLFGYPSVDLPNLRPTETFAFLPISNRTSTVSGYAADYYVFGGGENLVVNLDGPDDQLRFKAWLIKLIPNSSPEVLNFPLDGNNDGVLSIPDFGIGVSKVVLVPYYFENTTSAEYAFSAEGSGGPQAFNDTLQYHDQQSRTIISLGLPSPVLNDEHLDSYAVRFTPSSDGILTSAEFGVWDRTGSGGTVRFYFYTDDAGRTGHPSAKIDSVDVAGVTGTPGNITWNEVDFSARELQVRAGESFHLAWQLVNPGFGDTVFAIIDTAKVKTDRSSVFVRERQRWSHFVDGLNFFMRAIVSVPADPTVPHLTAGLLQNPVFSQAVDLFAISEHPLNAESVEGSFVLGDSVTALDFRPLNDSSKVFIAADFDLFASGVAQIVVSARHRFGIAAGSDTLDVAVNLIDAQKGGDITSPDNHLTLKVLPKAINRSTYFTTIREEAIEALITTESGTLQPTDLRYRIGPTGLTLGSMLELSFQYESDHVAVQSENDLTIAYLEDDQWVALGGELYRDRKTITTLVNRTGVYGLFVKKFSEPSDPVTPFTYYLNQNYPNPFNPKTNIKFGLEQRSHVIVRIINLKGQIITTLLDADLNAGDHALEWDATDDKKVPVASGVYLYQLQAGDFVDTKKLLLVK